MTPILILTAAISVGAAICLWFRAAAKELREKKDMVNSAESQYETYRRALPQLQGSPEWEHALVVTERSRDIYVQALTLYNQTLSRPANRIPGYFLGHRPIDPDR